MRKIKSHTKELEETKKKKFITTTTTMKQFQCTDEHDPLET
jgi:hypothetical protein